MYNMNQPGGMFGNPTVPPAYPQIQPTGGYMPSYPGRSVLPGRTVTKMEDIVPGDVPQDGSVGIFPQSDGSCIWAKSWNGDGTIRTMKFVPAEQIANPHENIEEDTKVESAVPDFQTLFDTVTNVKDSVDMLVNSLTAPVSKNQNGKDSDKEND